MLKLKSLLSYFILHASYFLLSGCTRERLTVYTDYLSRQNLASYHVGTPDPRLNNPPVGQRLIISWSLPKKYLCMDDLHLEATIRLWNHEEIKENIQLYKLSGTYIYSLINEDFFDTEGIMTYKVDLIGNNEVLDEWRHQLWTELIILNNEDEKDEEEEDKEGL